MKKRQHVTTLRTDPRTLTANQGHEYGAGRGSKVFRHKNERRSKDRLRKELREW